MLHNLVWYSLLCVCAEIAESQCKTLPLTGSLPEVRHLPPPQQRGIFFAPHRDKRARTLVPDINALFTQIIPEPHGKVRHSFGVVAILFGVHQLPSLPLVAKPDVFNFVRG